MSGGVDSAVALLRAGPNAIGVTLRLWLDPAGPDAERACCSPEAVIAARETCHALGLPHVTLDLREEFRRAVVDAVRPRLRARRDAEPVHPLQRRLPLRRAARVRAARRRRAARDGPLRADRRAPAAAAARARGRRRRRTSRTCSRRSIRACSTGSRSRSASRTRRRRAPRRRRRARRRGARARARRRASSPAATTATSSSGRASSRRGARSSTRQGRELGRHAGVWRFTPGQRRGIGVAAPSRSTRSARTPRRTRSSSARALARARTTAAAAGSTSRRRARRSSATARRPSPRPRRADGARLPPRARRAGDAGRPRPDRRALRGRRRRRRRANHASRTTRIARDPARQHRLRRRLLRPAAFLLLSGLGLAYMLFRLGGTFSRLSSFIRGTQTEAAARDHQDRKHGRPGERPAGQDGSRHRQRRGHGRQRRYGGAAVSSRSAPVTKVSGLAAGLSHGAAS